MQKLLGYKATEGVTGFTGIITAVVYYITGSPQMQITPQIANDGTWQESRWFDYQRLEIDTAGVYFSFHDRELPKVD